MLYPFYFLPPFLLLFFKETYSKLWEINVLCGLCMTDPRLCLGGNDAPVWLPSNKTLPGCTANALVLPMVPGLKVGHLSKLASVHSGRLILSRPKMMLTARHSILSVRTNVMLSNNAYVDIFPHNTVYWTWNRPRKRGILAFFIKWPKLFLFLWIPRAPYHLVP